MIRIVALGDSTTAGTPGFASPLEAPPHGRGDVTSQYAWWLMQSRPDWLVLNRGVNGERSDQIRARFDRDVVDASPSAVVIVAGVNDVYQGRSSEQVIEELRAMYDRAALHGIGVVAGSILPYNTAGAVENARMREINAWIAQTTAREPRMTFVDTRAAVAEPRSPDRLVDSPDGLHPSPAGYRQMAEALLGGIEGVLRSRGSTVRRF
jgi:lysophospholipase L1-like esterase